MPGGDLRGQDKAGRGDGGAGHPLEGRRPLQRQHHLRTGNPRVDVLPVDRPAVAPLPGGERGPHPHWRRRLRQDTHGGHAARAGVRVESRGPVLHRLVAGDAPEARPRRGQARPRALPGRPRAHAVVDEPGFLPLDPDGARPLFRAASEAYGRQSAAITTSLGFSRWGQVFGDDQMAAAELDRAVHHGRLLQFRGESHRARHALMQQGLLLQNPCSAPCKNCSIPDAISARILLTKHRREDRRPAAPGRPVAISRAWAVRGAADPAPRPERTRRGRPPRRASTRQWSPAPGGRQSKRMARALWRLPPRPRLGTDAILCPHPLLELFASVLSCGFLF